MSPARVEAGASTGLVRCHLCHQHEWRQVPVLEEFITAVSVSKFDYSENNPLLHVFCCSKTL